MRNITVTFRKFAENGEILDYIRNIGRKDIEDVVFNPTDHKSVVELKDGTMFGICVNSREVEGIINLNVPLGFISTSYKIAAPKALAV